MSILGERLENPSENDEQWQALIEDLIKNSSLAVKEWARFRAGLRRLERRYTGRVASLPLHRILAEEAFFCATHWLHSPGRVRTALRAMLRLPIGTYKYTFAAAELWLWASRKSPADLPVAEAMLKQAREAIPSLKDDWSRWNLTQMLASLPQRALLSKDDL